MGTDANDAPRIRNCKNLVTPRLTEEKISLLYLDLGEFRLRRSVGTLLVTNDEDEDIKGLAGSVEGR